MKQIVNFSGGKDSTAMLHLMLEKGEQIDDVIFFDGGWEWPQMYEHIELVEKKTGIKISRVKPSKPFDYWFGEHHFVSKKYGEGKGYGWPSPTARWCTREKTWALSNYLKSHYLFSDLIQCIGFAVGEERRAGRKGVSECRFPLIEYNYDEKECLLYCYSLGYKWGGLYDYFDRVSCFCCPLQSNKEMLLKKRHFPETWQKIKEMDASYVSPFPGSFYGYFKPDATLTQIDAKIRGKD